MSRVTLQTIADAVGVSRTTISNAYNRPNELSPALRHRILSVAEELGYRGPDAAARMLRTGRTGSIGLLFTEDLRYVFTDPDTTSFMQGVAETSALSGTGLALLPVPPGSDVADTAVMTTPVDGYLVFSVADGTPALDTILGRDRPVVVVDEPDLGALTSFVGIDDFEGARMAMAHLIDLGHRRLGVLVGRLTDEVITGPVNADREANATMLVARKRLAGCRAAMVDAGLDDAQLVVWESGGNDPDAGREAAKVMLTEHPELTALACFSDQIAIGASQAGHALGRSVPSELSLVGFDDVPRAATWDPPLTTIRQPMVDKGRAAAELLLELIGGAEPRRIDLDIELVVRASSVPPPD